MLLRNIDMELQALESKMALLQDAALSNNRSLSVTEKTYVSSPLLLKLKEMMTVSPLAEPLPAGAEPASVPRAPIPFRNHSGDA